MPFEIVRNDITMMAVDAIVNTANPRAVIGLGTDSMIHEAAGPGLLQARQKIGHIDMGQAAITPTFNLQANYVIHIVGPVWDGGSYGEEGYPDLHCRQYGRSFLRCPGGTQASVPQPPAGTAFGSAFALRRAQKQKLSYLAGDCNDYPRLYSKRKTTGLLQNASFATVPCVFFKILV